MIKGIDDCGGHGNATIPMVNPPAHRRVPGEPPPEKKGDPWWCTLLLLLVMITLFVGGPYSIGLVVYRDIQDNRRREFLIKQAEYRRLVKECGTAEEKEQVRREERAEAREKLEGLKKELGVNSTEEAERRKLQELLIKYGE